MVRQLSVFDDARVNPSMFTPCLVGRVLGFDPSSKWHDPNDLHLSQTRLLIRDGSLPRLHRPYVQFGREIHCGNAMAVGPGWINTGNGHFVIARSLPEPPARARPARGRCPPGAAASAEAGPQAPGQGPAAPQAGAAPAAHAGRAETSGLWRGYVQRLGRPPQGQIPQIPHQDWLLLGTFNRRRLGVPASMPVTQVGTTQS